MMLLRLLFPFGDATVILDNKANKATGAEGRRIKLFNAKDGSEMTAFGEHTKTIQIADISLDWPAYAPICS